MPLYEYECTKCSHRFEVIQKVGAKALTRCPKCRGKLRKLLSAPAIQFKGTGWYVTDYAGKEKGKDKGRDDTKPPESGADSKAEPGSAKKPGTKTKKD